MNITIHQPLSKRKVALKNQRLALKNLANGTKKQAVGTKKVDFIELLLIDLRENLEITVQQLSDHLQLSRRTILRYLDELKQEGIIQQVGSKRNPKWIIVKENENGR